MELQWQWCTFCQLDNQALHTLLQARQDVFVVEQSCAYRDIDGRDAVGYHLLGWDTRSETRVLAAYLRALPAGSRFKEASIGRILTALPYRARKLGHALVAEGIKRTLASLGKQPLRISAQSHLQPFYERHGFIGEGDIYLEDDIPHREMVRA